MTFLYLYAVALTNLSLGFGVARWLKKKRRPVVAEPHPSGIDRSANSVAPGPNPKPASEPATAPVNHPEAARSEALGEMIRELHTQSVYLEQQRQSLEETEPSLEELRNMNNEMDVAIQRILKTLNTTADSVSKTVQGSPISEVVSELENYWNVVSDEAVRLITLTFDEDERESTRDTMIDVCRSLCDVCGTAHQFLSAQITRNGQSEVLGV